MNVMDLVAKISLDSQEYEKGIGSAKSSFSALGSTIASGAKTIGKVGVAAFTAIGTAIGGATTALISNAKETAAYADNIDKLSQKMGFSAEAFQEWDFIAQHSGTSIDAIKGSIMKLDKALESDTDAWEKLGLSQEELLGMSSEEKFEATVKALQGVTDETEKAALAEEVFGKSYQEMMPLLNTSAEETEAMKEQVHELGGVMSDEAVKAGAQFQDSLQNLNTAMSGMKNNLMAEFLPSLSTVMDGLSALFSGDESGIGKIKQGIEDFAVKLNEKLPQVIQTIGGIATSLISALPQLFETIGSQLPTILEQAIPVLIDAVVGLADSVVSALPGLMTAIEKNIGKISSGLSKIVSSIGQIILKLTPVMLPMLLKVGVQLVTELAKGFTQNASEVIRVIFELVDIIVKELTNPETLSQLLTCGIQIVLALAQGILENLPMLLGTLGELLSNVIGFLVTDGIPMILESSIKLFESIGDGVTKAWSYITGKLGDLLLDILGTDGIGSWLNDILSKGQEMFESIGDGISNAWETIKQGITEFGEKIWNGIKDGVGDLWEKGKEMVMKIVEGIKDSYHYITDALTGPGISSKLEEKYKEMGDKAASGYVEGQEKGFDIHSPSRRMRYIGQMVMEGYAEGIEEETPDSMNMIQSAMDDVDFGVKDMTADAILNVKTKGAKDSKQTQIDQLVDLMNKVINNRSEMTFPIIVGGREIDEVIIDSKNRVTTRSGGRVNV